eukprot:XP_011408372.1 PREDICTED: uncharacterized protein LOC100633066 [Amphimedon queenslandica]
MQNSPSESDLLRALRQHFGYDSFRPLQLDIIQHALSGRDAVVLMPTGGGKSICYQLPALVRPGLTVVISPLIALMKDQVDALRANGIAAACLNSSLTLDEFEAVAKGLTSREIDLLYLSPERLFSGGCLSYLATLDIGLFAVDEAHCVSSWGHHFRPEYQRLNIIKEHFPETPVMALTATADKAVRSDIGESLGLVDPALFVASFDRPNLSMTVLPGRKKWEQLLPLVRRYPGQGGIVYCQSRNGTEGLAKKLQEHGFGSAKPYHAGLDTETRNRVQSAFIQGDCPIVCATIAFGMGIDKADVRFVVHWNMLTIAVRIRLGHRLIDAAHGNRFGARRPCLGGIRSLDATAFLADAGFGKNASLEDEAADARAKLAPQRSSRCDILASGLPQMDGIEPSAAPDGCGFFEISLPTPAFGTRRGGYSSGGFGSPTAFLARLTIVAAGRIIDAALRG